MSRNTNNQFGAESKKQTLSLTDDNVQDMGNRLVKMANLEHIIDRLTKIRDNKKLPLSVSTAEVDDAKATVSASSSGDNPPTAQPKPVATVVATDEISATMMKMDEAVLATASNNKNNITPETFKTPPFKCSVHPSCTGATPKIRPNVISTLSQHNNNSIAGQPAKSTAVVKRKPQKLLPKEHRSGCRNENAAFAGIREMFPAVPAAALWAQFGLCGDDPIWTIDLLLSDGGGSAGAILENCRHFRRVLDCQCDASTSKTTTYIVVDDD